MAHLLLHKGSHAVVTLLKSANETTERFHYDVESMKNKLSTVFFGNRRCTKPATGGGDAITSVVL